MADTLIMLRDLTNLPLPPSRGKQKKSVDSTKYKTEMCRNWIELGQCQYGSKCNFAHGREDLMTKVPANNKYKSKMCIPFHEKGYCTYGQRCLFLHSDLSLGDMQKPYQWTQLLLGKEGPKRLPVFQAICPDTRAQEVAEAKRIEAEAKMYLNRIVNEDLEVHWEFQRMKH